MNRIFKTAALALVAFTAFGANKEVNFEVQFPFTVRNAVMPAGRYTLGEVTPGRPGLALRSLDTKKQVFLMLPDRRVTKVSEFEPSVTFSCTKQSCSLHAVTNLRAGEVISAFRPKNGNLIVVSATRGTAEGE